eukprot:scaffold181523_cov17-Cyclotella_meneghiniana.AAC.1
MVSRPVARTDDGRGRWMWAMDVDDGRGNGEPIPRRREPLPLPILVFWIQQHHFTIITNNKDLNRSDVQYDGCAVARPKDVAMMRWEVGRSTVLMPPFALRF